MADSLNLYDNGVFSGMIQSNYEKYKEMFATSDASTLGQSDFLSLMFEQMKNQDITNPTDNTEFIAQMAQFSTLQAQQDLMKMQKQMMYYSKASYASSLVGKNVTIATYDKNNNIIVDQGVVESLRFEGEEFLFTVNGIEVTSDKIMSVNSNPPQTEEDVPEKENTEDKKPEETEKVPPENKEPETEEENGKTTYINL